MKRDVALIRSILFAIEASDDKALLRQYSRDEIIHHVHLAALAELIVLLDVEEDNQGLNACELSWTGYEALDLLRSESMWMRARDIAIGMEIESFEVLLHIARCIANNMIEDATGLDGSYSIN